MATITPIVGNIHWDDIARLFRVCVSVEVDSPLGNHRLPKVCVDAGTLAQAFLEISQIWGLAPIGDAANKITYPVGDPAVVTEALTALAALTSVVPTLPAGSAGAIGPDAEAVLYVGDYGVTVP